MTKQSIWDLAIAQQNEKRQISSSTLSAQHKEITLLFVGNNFAFGEIQLLFVKNDFVFWGNYWNVWMSCKAPVRG